MHWASDVRTMYREQQLWYQCPRSGGSHGNWFPDAMRISRSSHRFDQGRCNPKQAPWGCKASPLHEKLCVNNEHRPRSASLTKNPETTSLSIIEYDVGWGAWRWYTLRRSSNTDEESWHAKRNRCCSSTKVVWTTWIGSFFYRFNQSLLRFTHADGDGSGLVSLLVSKLFSPVSVVPQRDFSHPGIQSDAWKFKFLFLLGTRRLAGVHMQPWLSESNVVSENFTRCILSGLDLGRL
jgi:hypothetical protein